MLTLSDMIRYNIVSYRDDDARECFADRHLGELTSRLINDYLEDTENQPGGIIWFEDNFIHFSPRYSLVVFKKENRLKDHSDVLTYRHDHAEKCVEVTSAHELSRMYIEQLLRKDLIGTLYFEYNEYNDPVGHIKMYNWEGDLCEKCWHQCDSRDKDGNYLPCDVKPILTQDPTSDYDDNTLYCKSFIPIKHDVKE